MYDDDLVPGQNFRRNPDAPSIEELNRFLRSYGLTNELNDLTDEEDKMEIGEVLARLPERLDGVGNNAAYDALYNFYEAIPLSRRSRGVRLGAEKILSILMDRIEMHDRLGADAIRTCRGTECDHYEVCPFKELVADNTLEDGEDCMVDRGVVKNAIKNFIDPDDGSDPKIDPRRQVQYLLFEQLVQLLVKQKRIMLTMKKEDILTKHYEVLSDADDVDHFESKNFVEHPLMKAWDRTHDKIEDVLESMGVTPSFEIRQDLWETEDERLSSEKRSQELLLEKLSDTLERLQEGSTPEELQEKVTKKEALQEAIISTKKQAENRLDELREEEE